ncbi:MAG: M24 family metallopeptidase [Nevskiales bacterium]
MIQYQDFDAAQLERFKQLQRRAYATLEDIAATLRDGETELDVARRLRRAFAAQGVRSYFHVPVALFGERTAYPGKFGQLEALPTARRLQAGDAVILDAAPIFEGSMTDVSLSVPRGGGTAAFAQADALLRELRTLILTRTRERRSMREIAREVDGVIVARGFENCHRKHIGMVLAHRMAQVGPAWLSRRRIWGLSPLPVSWFFWRSFRSFRSDPALTPNWNHTRQCDCPPQPGLWAMEPHVAIGKLGAKFEEILVVTQREAYYLDEDLPHHRRWVAAGL